MKLLLVAAGILLASTGFAQLGVAKLATTHIAQSNLAAANIARSSIPMCEKPGQCQTGCAVYTFIGSGSWENPGNWEYGLVPPEIIDGCYEIHVNPVGDDKSVMIIPRAVITGGKVIVEAGKTLIVPGNLIIKKQE